MSSKVAETDPLIPSAKSRDATPGTKKKLKRVRKVRDRAGGDDPATAAIGLGAPVFKTFFSSPLYFLFVALRFLLIFTPAILEGIEFDEGVDSLAVALLPHMNSAGLDPAVLTPPTGMTAESNYTRSIVGAFISSGIPYMGANIVCNRFLDGCKPQWMGLIAMILPRVWMFMLSFVTDLFLLRVFAVYEGENALSALLTYSSLWTTLLAMTRNSNFALESMCLTMIVAACFGWPINTARPLFWLSAFALSLGVFLRPAFAFFAITPVLYLSNLWGKNGLQPLRYVRGAMEGFAIFALWCTIWISVDSVYFGTFKLRFGNTVMTSFDMFVEYATKGLPFSYKGKLIYTPINAMKEVLTRSYISTIAMHTSPGQMFLSLPAILGPFFIVLMRESYDGMKVAMKELMTELKQVANAKKAKKRKAKKAGMTKELEDELYVYFDTIQTTFLLGLLIEVIQNNDRLGTISLLSLMPICVVCLASTLFGSSSSKRFRMLNLAFTGAMVLFYGFFNQSGIPRVLLKVGAGGIDSIPQNADLVMFKGVIGHRSLLGPNMKNVSIHDAGDSRLKLMTTLRDLKGQDGYREDQLFVCAPATVEMKDEEFVLVDTLAYGHMAVQQLPNNIDDAFKKSSLLMYKFVGDEDEAIIRDDEEAAEQEEREREERNGGGSKEEL
ncbi:GPI mannosyltransferase [Gracilaria domingensis]|nr:GPI mannosyltransferase [Gracilaria domingensis]